ncbi:MAG: hypothetical protein RR539_09005 [Clostridium sp.]|uniref:hypothetical protein n=2 Tax=Clostridium sp. TaxID=1506 RepID=UPI002FC9C928
MKENSIMNSLGRLIYRGNRDYRTPFANFMGCFIVVNLILGLLALASRNVSVLHFYSGVDVVSLIYFVTVPIFMYDLIFKTGQGLYLFMAPIKKYTILFSAIKTWALGFSMFIILRNILSLALVYFGPHVIDFNFFIEGLDLVTVLLIFFRLVMLLLSAYMLGAAIDIISVVKKIPSTLIIIILGVLLYFIINMNNFLVFYGMERIDTVNYFILPIDIVDHLRNIVLPISMGQILIVFLLAVGLFVYAMSIFEGYSYDNKSRNVISIGKFKIKSLKGETIIGLLIGFIITLGPVIAYQTAAPKSESVKVVEVSNLQNVIDNKKVKSKSIKLSETTFFDFDKGYIVSPYTSIDEIKSVTGVNYNYSQSISDGEYQLILIKDKKVISYIYGKPRISGMLIDIKKDKFQGNIYGFTKENEPIFKFAAEEGSKGSYSILRGKI